MPFFGKQELVEFIEADSTHKINAPKNVNVDLNILNDLKYFAINKIQKNCFITEGRLIIILVHLKKVWAPIF